MIWKATEVLVELKESYKNMFVLKAEKYCEPKDCHLSLTVNLTHWKGHQIVQLRLHIRNTILSEELFQTLLYNTYYKLIVSDN